MRKLLLILVALIPGMVFAQLRTVEEGHSGNFNFQSRKAVNAAIRWINAIYPYITVEDGVITIVIDTISTDAITYTDTYWDDLKAPFTSTKVGALDKPDFDYVNVGLLFPISDTTEIASAIMQFKHKRKAATDIEPHIHWEQMNANDVVWSMVYKWYVPGQAVPATWLKLTEQSDAFTYTSGTLHQITSFGTIDGSDISGVSSIFKVKVYRDDAVAGGAGTGNDALAIEFDLHYQIDSPGSAEEYVK